jgi:hypothetical protein
MIGKGNNIIRKILEVAVGLRARLTETGTIHRYQA